MGKREHMRADFAQQKRPNNPAVRGLVVLGCHHEMVQEEMECLDEQGKAQRSEEYRAPENPF